MGPSLMELTGAEIVVRCLQEEGVDHVFGYPGGAVLYNHDALFQHDKVLQVPVRHEPAAVNHAAYPPRCTARWWGGASCL